jgi:hypothetical protein
MPANEKHAQMIQTWLDGEGYTDVTWAVNEYGRDEVTVGRFVVLEDHGNMLFEGEEGVLRVSVVGAAKYQNERVYLGLTTDGTESPEEVTDLSVLEAI